MFGFWIWGMKDSTEKKMSALPVNLKRKSETIEDSKPANITVFLLLFKCELITGEI